MRNFFQRKRRCNHRSRVNRKSRSYSRRLPFAIETLEARMMLSVSPGVPALHSLPGAPASVYLDFDGHFEPQWGNYPNITTPVYSIDGDYSTFSERELEEIQLMWARVAEDFAPFNIDVTTVEPDVLAEGQPMDAANGVALRVAIGGSTMDWFGQQGITGVGNINAFTNTHANTVYVFSNNGTTSPLGDTISHEAGHGFGLQHPAGDELLDDQWSSIMRHDEETASIWISGMNVVGQFQDDMAVIAGTLNGFGYRPDDHGNTTSAATPLSFDGGSYIGTGIIGTNDDFDIWSFSVGAAGSYRIAVDPAAIGPNLDTVLELRDAGGLLIASASPAATLGAELAQYLLPGAYNLSIGKTAIYGLVGTYTVEISSPAAGITATASEPLTVKETGGTAQFQVMLDTRPAADVTVSVASSNTGEGTVSTNSMVFTSSNWNVPQSVTLTGVFDAAADGDIPFSIVIGPSTSGDPQYDGLDPPDIAAANIDNSASGFIFFADTQNDRIQRSKLDGSDVETILNLDALYGSGSYSPRGVAVDPAGGKMYWTESVGRIQRANLNGSNVETLVSGLTGNGLRGGVVLDLAGDKMYWGDAAARKIQRANLDGSGVQDLITGASLSGVRDLVLDVSAGKMYWPDIEENNIRRANLDGSNIEVLWTGVEYDSPVAIDLDLAAGKMYWADLARDQIFAADMDGSNSQVVFDMTSIANGSAITGLALDLRHGKLYWSDLQTYSFYRANLDGSDVVEIAEAVPVGIAIVTPAVSVSPAAGLVTTEGGGSATFKVSLTTAPSADVTIPVQSSDSLEGAVAQASVTFTPEDWNVPQLVTITGVDDSTVDGDNSYSVLVGAAMSTDPDYNGIEPRDVSLTNLDDDLPPAPADILYFSLLNNATVGGVAAANEDILARDETGAFRLLFDGSDVGLSAHTLDAFDVIAANQILISLAAPASITGVGSVDDSDLVLFTASSLGENTAGTFSMYFDGSDVGLTTDNEDIDSLHRLDDGRLVMSTLSSASAGSVSSRGEDLIVFTPSSLGATTAGTWAWYVDGSDVGLSSSSENIDATALDAGGKIHLSTIDNFSAPGRSGADEDVFAFTPSRLGSSTAGSYSSTLFFDGSTFGLGSNDINGIDIPQPDFAVAALMDTSGDTSALDAAYGVVGVTGPRTGDIFASKRVQTSAGGNDFITTLVQPTPDVPMTARGDTDKEKAKFRNRLQREAAIDQALVDLDVQDHRLAAWDAL
ncbi:MAG: hypothetical protein WD851_22845 [Pirellulales bacterium]